MINYMKQTTQYIDKFTLCSAELPKPFDLGEGYSRAKTVNELTFSRSFKNKCLRWIFD